jgi:predicted DNA-binding protein with PD1-like motif
MHVKDVEAGFMIRLERGDELIASLVDFAQKRGIQSGFFHGLGAVKNVEIGYYPLETREYVFKKFPEDREVASMSGNIALVDGKPFVHAHAVLSACDDSLSCIGGHIKSAEVAVTLEILLTPFTGAIERKLDENIGLKLLDL